MATRTVRLDPETERMLAELQRASGESVSTLLKRGIMTLRASLANDPTRPYRIYETLELGEGGYALAPARHAKRGVRTLLRRKHGRK